MFFNSNRSHHSMIYECGDIMASHSAFVTSLSLSSSSVLLQCRWMQTPDSSILRISALSESSLLGWAFFSDFFLSSVHRNISLIYVPLFKSWKQKLKQIIFSFFLEFRICKRAEELVFYRLDQVGSLVLCTDVSHRRAIHVLLMWLNIDVPKKTPRRKDTLKVP